MKFGIKGEVPRERRLVKILKKRQPLNISDPDNARRQFGSCVYRDGKGLLYEVYGLRVNGESAAITKIIRDEYEEIDAIREKIEKHLEGFFIDPE